MTEARITIPVWYDFASTLCYVAHRVMERMAPELEGLGLWLDWQPLDLTQLLGPYPRGEPMPDERRANARRVADDLGVAVDAPAVWHDSRAVGAAAIALALAAGSHEATWRERVFSALFEERREAPDEAETAGWIRELGWSLPADALATGRTALRYPAFARTGALAGTPDRRGLSPHRAEHSGGDTWRACRVRLSGRTAPEAAHACNGTHRVVLHTRAAAGRSSVHGLHLAERRYFSLR